MNHNEDIAYKTIKIISKTDSYNKNSGALIINGGIGCKNSIHSKNICSDEGCFKNIITETISFDKITNDNIHLEKLSIDDLDVANAEIDNAEIQKLYLTKCIFESIIPKNENSLIGNEDNKVNIISNNLKAQNIDSLEFNSNTLNSNNILSDDANIKKIVCQDLKSENNEFNNVFFNKILPLNESSQIGDDNNRPKINADNLSAYNGEFKIQVKTDDIIADKGKINLLKGKNVEIENLELEYGIYDKLLPETSDSFIGNENNRANIFASKINSQNIDSLTMNTNNLISDNLTSNNSKIDILKGKNVEIEKLELEHGIYDKLLPETSDSFIGNENNRTNIFASKINSQIIDSLSINTETVIANSLISNNSKIDILKNDNIETNCIKLKHGIYNELLPETCDSFIGNEENRTNIFASKINSQSINTLTINTNNLISTDILSNIIKSDTLETDIHKFNCIIPINENSQIGNDENRPNIFGNNLNVNSLNSNKITGKFESLMPINEESNIGDEFNRINIFGNKFNVNNLITKKINGNIGLLLPIDENSSIGNLINRINLFADNIDVNKCTIKKLEVIDELKVNKMESIETFQYGKLIFNEGKFNYLLPEDYNSYIGTTDNRFNLYTNKIDSNFGKFNENLESLFLKTNTLNVTENVYLSKDYRNNEIISTDCENSKLNLKGDIINITSNFDNFQLTDDGIEIDGLTILNHIVINTNAYSSECIYPYKSLILITGDTCRKYILSNNKSINSNTTEIKNGAIVKVVNISNYNIVINGYILCNDADFYDFIYFNKWYCLNKGQKYDENTSNHDTSNNLIITTDNNCDSSNECECEDEHICNLDDITYCNCD